MYFRQSLVGMVAFKQHGNVLQDEFDSDDSEYGSEDEDNGSFHHAGLNISELFTEDEDATHSPKVGTFLLEELSPVAQENSMKIAAFTCFWLCLLR